MTNWKKVSDNWKKITDTYVRLFKIPDEVIEYVAVYDYVLLSVSGKSNEVISFLHSTDEEYIKSVCREFLEFDGWEVNLDISPIFIMKNVNCDYDSFVIACKSSSDKITEGQIKQAYDICKKFINMEIKIDEYYY